MQSYRPPFAGPTEHIRSHSSLSADAFPPTGYPPTGGQVIDLTGSPSPSPRPSTLPQMQAGHHAPHASQPYNPQTALKDINPKTPVCIGQLSVTALILYPTEYLRPTVPPDLVPAEEEWVPVRLQYERNVNRPGSEDTIHIKTPNKKNANGEAQPGDDFAVVEQKVASALGPMLGKGLIRLDAKVRRGNPNLPILPLEALVFTPKGNIPVVGSYMRQSGLLLDHPRPNRCSVPYCNPHNPPPGGFSRNLLPPRMGYNGPGGSSTGRWATGVTGKSVEVQRSQVDELFKSLRSGDELQETEPPPEVGTKLYPHQKRALTFLLEREREIPGPDGIPSSLWQARTNPLSGQTTWTHLVTQRDVSEQPVECKGAILADDMGLGKTITCVSLIAATLPSARTFEASPIEQPKPPVAIRAATDPTLSASHFSGRVYGMPDVPSVKARAKEAKMQEQADASYARACRIKFKTRATLIICPLSTVSNWEDQFREHWNGTVQVTGGSGTCPPAEPHSSQAAPLTSLDVIQFTANGRDPPDPPKPVVNGQNSPILRVYVYHGNARRPDPGFLADCDVVITTFSTLASEFSKQSRSVSFTEEDGEEHSSDSGMESVKPSKSKKAGKRKRAANGSEATSPLQSVHWFRVVLDEAHSIKELNTVACRASCDLMADRRLCLTGTPVQNKLDDIFALIKFLKLDPLDDKATWTEFIGTPVKYGQPLGVARLQSIMKCITLRRTKESKSSNGQRILDLPPRRDELRYLKFDAEEQDLYDRFFNESRAEFHELSHKNEVMKNYVGILQKILRLRQICDHSELVKGKGILADSQQELSYEDTVAAIVAEGITVARASVIFCLLREAATTQCAECGTELCPALSEESEWSAGAEGDTPAGSKRGRKPKTLSSRNSTNSGANSPAVTPRPILTRCQHLLCLCCFRRKVDLAWPDCAPDVAHPCPVCQNSLLPSDAVEVDPNYVAPDSARKPKSGKREKRVKGGPVEDFRPSTKVKALLGDLVQFSKANPHSVNYDPASLDVQMVDDQGNILDDGVTKTVVFSQWTSMLDRVEDALDAVGIRYDRLDGTMKREERTRAMEALKHDPGCEVLLVSLKAGGVGLNLTAAQRVYLMDPYWNPAVENQAVDRIHRLGQTKPVTTVKLIIENSIEARLLEVQKKKTELANMTLGQNLSKAELNHRRMEELNQLFTR
ncbi:hypothetical protein BV25DRAFT_1793096 [Artomyces pyxidatus]|uniref:Uncharacterized protein n=1 Tax=Artomyces pyxidatus TaxID=48021 RepID=A0ACB8TIQ2_9AGAM|nr:hypothetical protein BV25DRAFT_1793096 [Artomyces pyxidatus]